MPHAATRVARAERASTWKRRATPAMPPARIVIATIATRAKTKPITLRLNDCTPSPPGSTIDVLTT
jgi:hypothetical protein